MPWRKLLLALLTLVVALAAAELGHRLWLGARGEAYSRAAARRELESLRDFAANYAGEDAGEERDGPDRRGFQRYSGRDVLHPYHAVDRPEGARQVAAELEVQRRRPEELRILIAGGSVAAIFGRLGTPRLEALLREDPRFAERPIRFLRYGRAGSKQPQQLTLVANLVSLGMAPDAVIELDGFNEVAIGTYNHAHGTHPTFPARDKWLTLASGAATEPEALELAHELRASREALRARAEAAAESPLIASSILGGRIVGNLRALRNRIALAQRDFVEQLGRRELPQHLLGPPFEGDEAAALRLVADHWRESSYSMHLLCAARGIAYLHVLQPAVHDEGSKPLTPEEVADAEVDATWVRGVRGGYPLLRERGAELAASGVRFLDASAVFAGVEERLYDDSCHFGERGNELLAEAIAPVLLELLPAD